MRRASLKSGIRAGSDRSAGHQSSYSHHSNSSRLMIMPKLHLSRRIQHAITGLVLLLVSYIISPFPAGFLLLAMATVAFYNVHRKRIHDEAWDKWYLEQFGDLLREHERGEWEDDVHAVHVVDKNGSNSNNHNNEQSHSSHDTPTYKRRRRKTHPALPGAYYFLLGTTLSTLLFPTIVARTSLLVLSIADPMAGLAGVWFTETLGCNMTWKRLFRVGDGGPSLAGSMACAISTILCTYVYIASVGDNSTIPTDGDGLSLSFKSRCCIGIVTALAEAMGGRRLPVIGATTDDNLLIPVVAGYLIEWLSE